MDNKMKKFHLLLIFSLLFFVLAQPSFATLRIRAFTEIEGGGAGAMDAVPCSNLEENHIALSYDVNSESVYFYWFDDGATDAESSPSVIRPDDYSSCGDGVWKVMGFANLTFGGFTANRALETDGSGNLEASDVTDTELALLDGLTGTIKTSTTVKIIYAISIIDPADADHDDIKIKLPNATTSTGVYGISIGGTSVVINCKEVDADGDDSDAVTIDGDWTVGTTQFSDTSFTNAALDANDWLQCDVGTVTGSVTNVSLTIWGYE